MKINTVKRLLRDGKPAIGGWIQLGSVLSTELMSHIGFDWVAIDIEHIAVGIESLQNMFIAIQTTEAQPFCRLTSNDEVVIKQVLDAGAMGVIVPMVCSAEDAVRAVKACKYPPQGIRGSGSGRWKYFHGADYSKFANDEIMVVVQIEHIDAVNRIEEILSVPGIDACFIGPNDLAWSMGLSPNGPGEKDPSHAEALAKILAGAKKCGVPAGIHCRSAEEVITRAEAGYQFMACMSDAYFLQAGASKAMATIKPHLKR